MHVHSSFGIRFNKVTCFLGLISVCDLLLCKNNVLLKYLLLKFNLAAPLCSGTKEAHSLSLRVHVRNVLAHNDCVTHMRCEA